MFRSLLALFKRPASPALQFRLVGWEEVLEHPETPDEWPIISGGDMPSWAWNAIVRRELMPVPEPVEGQYDWGGDGVRVVQTGQFFPLGSVMHRSALSHE